MTTAENNVVLRAVDITKRYGGVHALKGVGFEVRPGKVTALFGENGAGKSTLMKIMSGVESPSGGHLELRGEVVELNSTTAAVELGISIIHQELNLCANLSVSDNIFLGREMHSPSGNVDYAKQRAVTRELMERLEEDIDPRTMVSGLRLGQQQIVEIARALAVNTSILIMDEPTSALSASEVEVLFRVIHDLKNQGVAIVYISHHLEEAMEIADYAVVFRDGELVAAELAEKIDLSWVVSRMTGRSAEYDFSDSVHDFGPTRLRVSDLDVAASVGSGRLAVGGVSLEVHAKEVVCLYGLMGAGRTELLEALAGRGNVVNGTVELDGVDITGSLIRDRIAMGLSLVPEDRQRDGLVQLMSVGANLSLPAISRLSKRGAIARSKEKIAIQEQIDNVRVKTEGHNMPVTSLSGGNQQKVVVGKMLMTHPKVLLLDEPTRGIDVGAKGEIFTLLFEQAAAGLAVLYATSELNEALAASHRIVVMSKGRIVEEFDPATADRDEIMAASGESDAAVESPGEDR
ncbi:MAG: sugar ABC transporter ATP-binding protein [Acidimicrobiia bacterium]